MTISMTSTGGKFVVQLPTLTDTGQKFDHDFFALIDSPSSGQKLTANQKYKVTVVKEAWDGSDNGKTVDLIKVLKGNSSTNIADSNNEFTADGTSDYFLQINGKADEDAQYSVFLDIV